MSITRISTVKSLCRLYAVKLLVIQAATLCFYWLLSELLMQFFFLEKMVSSLLGF